MHHAEIPQYVSCSICQLLAKKQHNTALIKFIVQPSKYEAEFPQMVNTDFSKNIRKSQE